MSENTGYFVFGIALGFMIGVVLVIIVQAIRKKSTRSMARELIAQAQTHGSRTWRFF